MLETRFGFAIEVRPTVAPEIRSIEHLKTFGFWRKDFHRRSERFPKELGNLNLDKNVLQIQWGKPEDCRIRRESSLQCRGKLRQ